MEKPRWQVRSRTYIVESKYLRLRRDEIELPDGAQIDEYYIRESQGFMIVFALTPQRDVVVVHQYRYGIDRITLELPAGALEEGEHPLACAKRELLEETGFTAPRWETLIEVPSDPVRSNSIMHAYIAYDAVRTHEQQLDEGEDVEWSLLSIDELLAKVRDGEVAAVPSVAAIYAALDRLGSL